MIFPQPYFNGRPLLRFFIGLLYLVFRFSHSVKEYVLFDPTTNNIFPLGMFYYVNTFSPTAPIPSHPYFLASSCYSHAASPFSITYLFFLSTFSNLPYLPSHSLLPSYLFLTSLPSQLVSLPHLIHLLAPLNLS